MIIDFESGDPADEKFTTIENERQKLDNIRVALQNQTDKSRNAYIAELQAGLGQQMKQALQNPELLPKVKFKSRWQKCRESIGNIFNKIMQTI